MDAFRYYLSTSHSFFNIAQVLYLYPNKKIFFLSNENLLFLLWPGEHLIHCRSETKVGLIPLGCSCHSITTTGLKWNLSTYLMKEPIEIYDAANHQTLKKIRQTSFNVRRSCQLKQ